MKIRLVNVETDLPVIVNNYSAHERNKNILAEEVRSFLEKSASGRITQMFVAVDENNAIQGHVEISHEIWNTPGQFIIFILVVPTSRDQKIGSALWDASTDFLQGHTVTRLISSVWDDEPASLAFAQQRDFSIERHVFTSHLDVDMFDEASFLPAIAQAEDAGIHFGSLADFPDTPATNQKYCELSAAIDRDMPGMDWDFTNYADFFQQHVLGSPWYRREGQLLAIDGDTWVGYASVYFDPASGRARNATTGVIRSYRGRKIAQALKVQAVRYARRLRARQMDTLNDSLNVHILAINQKMGYQSEPGKYKLIRKM